MSDFWFPKRPLSHFRHHSMFEWAFFWWLILLGWLANAFAIAVIFVFIALPVNIVRALTGRTAH